jgi:LysR family hydrogen peroxide-inducible transcriptional activator
MNIRDFEYIIAVDKLKSFIKASKQCFVSQPALSMQIQKVEDILGIKIFERTRKSIITTKEGDKVIALAKNILEHFNVIKSIRHDVKNLRIGAIHTISSYLFPKIVAKIGNNTNTSVSFSAGKTDELIDGLMKGEMDGIIISSSEFCQNKKLVNSANVETTKLYMEKFFLALPGNHAFKPNNKVLSYEEFKSIALKENLILLEEGHCLTDNIQQICQHYKLDLNASKTQLFTSSIETIKQIIKQENGISILPEMTILKDEGIKYFEMPLSESRIVSLMFRKNSSKMEPLNQILDIVKNVV